MRSDLKLNVIGLLLLLEPLKHENTSPKEVQDTSPLSNHMINSILTGFYIVFQPITLKACCFFQLSLIFKKRQQKRKCADNQKPNLSVVYIFNSFSNSSRIAISVYFRIFVYVYTHSTVVQTNMPTSLWTSEKAAACKDFSQESCDMLKQPSC